MNLCAMCCGFYQRFVQPKCKRTNCKCKYLMGKKTQQTATENNQIHKNVRHNLWLKREFFSSKMEYLLCHFIHWKHCIRIWERLWKDEIQGVFIACIEWAQRIEIKLKLRVTVTVNRITTILNRTETKTLLQTVAYRRSKRHGVGNIEFYSWLNSKKKVSSHNRREKKGNWSWVQEEYNMG